MMRVAQSSNHVVLAKVIVILILIALGTYVADSRIANGASQAMEQDLMIAASKVM